MALREMMPWRKRELAEREVNPFDSLRREMNRMLAHFAHGFGELAEREALWPAAFPAVDVVETEKAILVTAEIPGLDEKDVDVSLSGNNLVLRGEKKAEKEERGEQYYRRESTYGAFHRVIPLPVEIDEDSIEATYKKGVLKIVLPKSEEARKASKRIPVH